MDLGLSGKVVLIAESFDPYAAELVHAVQREGALAVTEIGCRRLQMNWNRIVDGGFDTAASEEFLQFVAALGLHDEGVESVELDVAAGWDERRCAREFVAVLCRVAPPPLDHGRQMAQPDP